MTQPAVLNVYGANTPNYKKVLLLLEEKNIEHKYHHIDFSKNDQFNPEFLKFSPNNKIPAIKDDLADGKSIGVFESGAILIYLSQKFGFTDLYPDYKSEPELSAHVNQWIMFQMSGQGPMTGQLGWFNRQPEPKDQFAINRYTEEVKRLYSVLDKQLAANTYVTGEKFNLADITLLGWALYLLKGYYTDVVDRASYPNVYRWLELCVKRPAVAKVLETVPQKQ